MLCISVTRGSRVHFSKSTLARGWRGGLIVLRIECYARACVRETRDRAGRAGDAIPVRERDPMEMDGRSPGTVIVPRTSASPCRLCHRLGCPGYNPPSAVAAAALGLALDGPPADSTLCRAALWPGIRMSPLDLAHMARIAFDA